MEARCELIYRYHDKKNHRYLPLHRWITLTQVEKAKMREVKACIKWHTVSCISKDVGRMLWNVPQCCPECSHNRDIYAHSDSKLPTDRYSFPRWEVKEYCALCSLFLKFLVHLRVYALAFLVRSWQAWASAKQWIPTQLVASMWRSKNLQQASRTATTSRRLDALRRACEKRENGGHILLHF